MNGIINENQLTIAKENEYDKPLIHKLNNVTDNVIRDFHDNFFLTFKYR